MTAKTKNERRAAKSAKASAHGMTTPLEENVHERTFSDGVGGRFKVTHYASALCLELSFDVPDGLFNNGPAAVHDLHESAYWRVDVIRREAKHLRFEFSGSITAQLGVFTTIIFRPEEVE